MTEQTTQHRISCASIISVKSTTVDVFSHTEHIQNCGNTHHTEINERPEQNQTHIWVRDVVM